MRGGRGGSSDARKDSQFGHMASMQRCGGKNIDEVGHSSSAARTRSLTLWGQQEIPGHQKNWRERDHSRIRDMGTTEGG